MMAKHLRGRREGIVCINVDCNDTFSTLQELKDHMQDCDDHDYCYDHDIGFADYEAYLKHLVEAEDHHACVFCGRIFKSEGGQLRHQTLVSP